MKSRLIGPALLALLASCTDKPDRAPDPDANVDAASAVIDNVTTVAVDSGWADMDPELRFDRASEANRLRVPAALRGASLGYFGDAPMIAQYGAAQVARMRSEQAGFSLTGDRDGDGAPETYRTGFWQRGDEHGTFLVVFERGVQKGLVQTGDAGVFLSRINGRLEVAACNCSHSGAVSFVGDRLSVTFSD